MGHFTFSGYSFPVSAIRKVLIANSIEKETEIAKIILRQQVADLAFVNEIAVLVGMSLQEKIFDFEKFDCLIVDKYAKVLRKYYYFLENKKQLEEWNKNEVLEYEKHKKEIEKIEKKKNKGENIVSKFFRWFRLNYYGHKLSQQAKIGNILDIRKFDFDSYSYLSSLEELKGKADYYKELKEKIEKEGSAIISQYQEIKNYEDYVINNQNFQNSIFAHFYLEYNDGLEQWTLFEKTLELYKSSVMKEILNEKKLIIKTSYKSKEEDLILKRIQELFKKRLGFHFASYDNFDSLIEGNDVSLYSFNNAEKKELLAEVSKQHNEKVFELLKTMLKYNEDAIVYVLNYS